MTDDATMTELPAEPSAPASEQLRDRPESSPEPVEHLGPPPATPQAATELPGETASPLPLPAETPPAVHVNSQHDAEENGSAQEAPPVALSPSAPGDEPVAPLDALEYRVRRLEESVHSLQDTHKLEERVVERMARRLSRDRSRNKEPAGVVVDSSRVFLPMTIEPARAETAGAAEEPAPAKEPPADPPAAATVLPVAPLIEPPTAKIAELPTAIVAELPTAKAIEPPIAELAPPLAPRSLLARPAWLVFDLLSEALAILRMFVDPHYRLGWSARVVPLVLLALMVLSWFCLSGVPLFGTWLDKAVDLVLAFFLYKVLSREARRYRETFPTLVPPRHR